MKVKRKFSYALLAAIFFCVLFTPRGWSEEEVKVKILAVNPSADKSLKTTITQTLPAEITSEQDILNRDEFTIKYNPDKKAFQLYKEVELQPKEIKTLEVKIRNVWIIGADELAAVKSQLDQNLDTLKDTKYYETGKMLYDKNMETISQIEEGQGKPLGIKQRVELYHVNTEQLKSIQTKAFSLEAMHQIEEEKKNGVREATFSVTAENPSDEEREMSVSTILPKEITPEDVLEKLDFNLFYDQKKEAYSLEKKDKFAPKEKKAYKFVLRDIWFISPQEIDYNRSQINKLFVFFEGTSYEKYAIQQKGEAFKMLDEIGLSQTEVADTPILSDRMRVFVIDNQKLDIVKQKIRWLQDLLPELPLKTSEGKLSEKLQNFIKEIAKTAMGFSPSKKIAWMIILGIVAFLAIITTLFYLSWMKKLQENRFQKKDVKGKKPEGEKPQPEKVSEPANTT